MGSALDRLRGVFTEAHDSSVLVLAARHSVRALAIAAGAFRMHRVSEAGRAARDRLLLETFRAAYACAVAANASVPEPTRIRLLREARWHPGDQTPDADIVVVGETLRGRTVEAALAVSGRSIQIGCSVPALDAGASVLTADAAQAALVRALETDASCPSEVMTSQRLWPDLLGPAGGALGRLRIGLHALPDGWSVWIDWLERVSLTPSEIPRASPLRLGIDRQLWASGAAAANAAIRAMETLHEPARTPVLAAAEDAPSAGDADRDPKDGK